MLLPMIGEVITDYCVRSRSMRNLFGLSEKMARALGEPDIKPCSDMSRGDGLYSIERVETWLDANQSKHPLPTNQHAEAAASTTLEWAHRVAIEATPITWDVWWKAQQRLWGQLSEQAKIDFIRHHMTNYHTLIRQLADKPAPHVAYVTLRARADALIRGWLQECQV